MEVDGKDSPWHHCRLMMSRHATWSCLLSVGNALSIANLFCHFFSFAVTSHYFNGATSTRCFRLWLTLPMGFKAGWMHHYLHSATLMIFRVNSGGNVEFISYLTQWYCCVAGITQVRTHELWFENLNVLPDNHSATTLWHVLVLSQISNPVILSSLIKLCVSVKTSYVINAKSEN